MGLMIHYQGHFNPKASLVEMIDEVNNIAEINEWSTTVFNKNFPDQSGSAQKKLLYGLILSLPESESVFLCFTADRRLANPVWLDADTSNLEAEDLLHSLFTKTQYAGIEMHKKIVHLLKYLSAKYFDEFSVIDEGGYWETGDGKVLEENFNKYHSILNAFTSQLKDLPVQYDESPDELVNRIVQLLKNNPNFKGLEE